MVLCPGPGHVLDLGFDSLLVALGGLDDFQPLIMSYSRPRPSVPGTPCGGTRLQQYNELELGYWVEQ